MGLNVAKNLLSGSLPQNATNWPVSFDISDNPALNSTLPPDLLVSSPHIQALFTTPGSGPRVGPWPDLSNVTNSSLSVLHAAFSNPIPSSISRLSALRDLRVDRGGGTLPAEIGELPSLQTLNLAGMGLTGSLPSELGNVTTLARLRFDLNALTGTLPPSLSKLLQLVELRLDSNRFNSTCWPWPETIPSRYAIECNAAGLSICCDSPLPFPFCAVSGCVPCSSPCDSSCNGPQPSTGYTCIQRAWTSPGPVTVSPANGSRSITPPALIPVVIFDGPFVINGSLSIPSGASASLLKPGTVQGPRSLPCSICSSAFA